MPIYCIILCNFGVKEVSIKVNGEDYKKYMFEGKIFPKNRLVLAIVKKYVEEHLATVENNRNLKKYIL